MPLPPPVTNARFPERSITAPPNAEWGVRNAEYAGNCRGPNDPPFQFRIPHSAFRTPHSSFQALLHHAANHMLDGEMNFLDPRRVVRGNDQHDVAQVFEPAARMPHEAHDRHPAGLRGLCGADHIGAFPARRDRKSTRLNSSHVSISYAVFCLKKKKKITITVITII